MIGSMGGRWQLHETIPPLLLNYITLAQERENRTQYGAEAATARAQQKETQDEVALVVGDGDKICKISECNLARLSCTYSS